MPPDASSGSGRTLTVEVERWPIAGSFTIARGSRTEAVVVVATIAEGARRGRGECVPYARYGETVEGVVASIESARGLVEAGCDRTTLARSMAPGAARNALDCALWDLEAKQANVPAHVLAGITRLAPATTCYTISLGLPEVMAEKAAEAADRPILKIKLGSGQDDRRRLAAVRAAAPDSTLLVDANEGWNESNLERHLAACAEAGVVMVEQPLPAGQDDILEGLVRPVPLCADESAHGIDTLFSVAKRYDAINVKLDKTGGLTAALALVEAAQTVGLGLMVGCMVGTSLSMAPALLLARHARFVDLDGPLLLARDREEGLRYEGSIVYPPTPALWG
jgi:L-alanine-DL-glutamate epimerase-like enolase superfamily enzyme